MLKLIVALFALLFSLSPALAAWEDTFPNLYREKGIDEAVIRALAEGANPDQIIKVALPLENLTQEALIKALFCALAQPEAIRDAAKSNSITDTKVDEGYQLALASCARQMEENLNATIIQAPQFPELAPSNRIRRTVYGSPWQFE